MIAKNIQATKKSQHRLQGFKEILIEGLLCSAAAISVSCVETSYMQYSHSKYELTSATSFYHGHKTENQSPDLESYILITPISGNELVASVMIFEQTGSSGIQLMLKKINSECQSSGQDDLIECVSKKSTDFSAASKNKITSLKDAKITFEYYNPSAIQGGAINGCSEIKTSDNSKTIIGGTTYDYYYATCTIPSEISQDRATVTVRVLLKPQQVQGRDVRASDSEFVYEYKK